MMKTPVTKIQVGENATAPVAAVAPVSAESTPAASVTPAPSDVPPAIPAAAMPESSTPPPSAPQDGPPPESPKAKQTTSRLPGLPEAAVEALDDSVIEDSTVVLAYQFVLHGGREEVLRVKSELTLPLALEVENLAQTDVDFPELLNRVIAQPVVTKFRRFLQKRFEAENLPYKGIDWELEDLLPESFHQAFAESCPGAIAKVTTAGGKTHRDLTRDGKAKFHRFIKEHAVHADLQGVIATIRALRFYLGLPAL